MKRSGKNSLWVIGTAILYAVFVAATAWFLRYGTGLSQPAQVILALSPIIPGMLLVWVNLRQFRDMDEFIRKIQLDSLAIAAAGTGLLTMSYGFLEITGFPQLSMFYVWPVTAALWLVSIVVQTLWHTRGASRT